MKTTRPYLMLVRYRWSILLVGIAAIGWWLAFRYLITFRTPDVEFITTPESVIHRMLVLADVKPEDVVYDLGSGDGRILLHAVQKFGVKKAVGFEIDPELVDLSRRRIADAGLTEQIRIIRDDLFEQDFRGATVITMYLKPYLNTRLRPQLDALPPGCRIVSHYFSMPGAKPKEVLEVPSEESGLTHKVYLFVTPIEWIGK